MHQTSSTRPTSPLTMLLAAAAAVSLVLASALPALAHAGADDHSDDGDRFAGVEFADPVIWDEQATVDCTAAGQGTIVWTLTGSTGVEYAELHIDEPVRSVTTRNAAPYVWISPLYALDAIGADVDRIVGELADDARLDAVYCPEGGEAIGQRTSLAIGAGVVAGAALGLLIGRRRTTPSA
jgi:hypothetical protein